MDATAIKVFHIKRAYTHRVFKLIATKSKTSTGWFFGLKLHLIINDLGEVMNFQLITGKTNDRLLVENLCKHLMGKMFADKGVT